MFFCFLLIGCDGTRTLKEKEDHNDGAVLIDNEPILGCNIPTIDSYNVSDVYFENGVVSKILFVSTYPDRDTFEEKKTELEGLFGEVNVSGLSVSLEINGSNDRYMEYIGMDKVSIGYICR